MWNQYSFHIHVSNTYNGHYQYVQAFSLMSCILTNHVGNLLIPRRRKQKTIIGLFFCTFGISTKEGIPSTVKTDLLSYCVTCYSIVVWFRCISLKQYVRVYAYYQCSSRHAIDFSTLYTYIPHSKLKKKIKPTRSTVFHC